MFTPSTVGKVLSYSSILIWDIWLTLFNLVAPRKKVGAVVPKGNPGFGGKWPEFVPPKEGDSRCCCPALNAMANHGILPHDGRNITFKEMDAKIHTTYNFAATFCRFVPMFSANFLGKNYNTDTLDLADLNLHNSPGIEHDASLTRQDAHFDPEQSAPYLPFIHDLLASATGKDEEGNLILTPADLSRYSAKRRAEARANNPEFVLDFFHKMFGSSNSSTLLTIFGGRVTDLEILLTEERIPEGWESRVRTNAGLTFLAFNKTVNEVERGIKAEEVQIGNAPNASESQSRLNGAATV
ncbi:Chloroperoxidase [Roridomyces roridus]|uniref:Chloroperoxidase n=1 Tax=Roridomyces roridus TaxID=1738132 RepID=A0AAD7FM46_9AGAR|nr:Chloroperoxidase [Roridomyces roridus]